MLVLGCCAPQLAGWARLLHARPSRLAPSARLVGPVARGSCANGVGRTFRFQLHPHHALQCDRIERCTVALALLTECGVPPLIDANDLVHGPMENLRYWRISAGGVWLQERFVPSVLQSTLPYAMRSARRCVSPVSQPCSIGAHCWFVQPLHLPSLPLSSLTPPLRSCLYCCLSRFPPLVHPPSCPPCLRPLCSAFPSRRPRAPRPPARCPLRQSACRPPTHLLHLRGQRRPRDWPPQQRIPQAGWQPPSACKRWLPRASDLHDSQASWLPTSRAPLLSHLSWQPLQWPR